MRQEYINKKTAEHEARIREAELLEAHHTGDFSFMAGECARSVHKSTLTGSECGELGQLSPAANNVVYVEFGK